VVGEGGSTGDGVSTGGGNAEKEGKKKKTTQAKKREKQGTAPGQEAGKTPHRRQEKKRFGSDGTLFRMGRVTLKKTNRSAQTPRFGGEKG